MYVSSANPTHLEACTYASAFSNVALSKARPGYLQLPGDGWGPPVR